MVNIYIFEIEISRYLIIFKQQKMHNTTSHVAKELIAKHIDSYLHSLSSIPGADKVVGQLRKIQPNVFQHLVALRRPNDELGAR